MTRYRVQFELDLRTTWDRSGPARQASAARLASGSTSVRVSRATAAALVELSQEVWELTPRDERPHWRRSGTPWAITADELLGQLAAGLLQVQRVHAKGDRTMHAPGGGHSRTHANPDVRNGMHGDPDACIADPRQLPLLAPAGRMHGLEAVHAVELAP